MLFVMYIYIHATIIIAMYPTPSLLLCFLLPLCYVTRIMSDDKGIIYIYTFSSLLLFFAPNFNDATKRLINFGKLRYIFIRARQKNIFK